MDGRYERTLIPILFFTSGLILLGLMSQTFLSLRKTEGVADSLAVGEFSQEGFGAQAGAGAEEQPRR